MTVTGTLEQHAEALEREAAAIRKLIEATRELGDERVTALLKPMLNGNGNGHTEAPPEPRLLSVDEIPEDAPRGREAVRRIVHEKPGLWTLANLRAAMKLRGWYTSDKGVDVAVTRLVASGEARRVGKGRYVFSAPEERDAP